MKSLNGRMYKKYLQLIDCYSIDGGTEIWEFPLFPAEGQSLQ